MNITRKVITNVCLVAVIPFLIFSYLYLYSPSDKFRNDRLIISIAAFIIILGTLSLLKLSRLVVKLSNNLNTIANGNFNHKVNVDKANGVVGMALSINQVSQKLRESADELEKRAILIERYNQELKRLSEIKSMYLSDFAHELRAPLINIDKSSVFLLEKKGSMFDSETDSCLKVINNNAGRLMRLIDNLLEISKIESGQLSIKRTLLDVREIINEAINSVAKWKESRKLWIGVNIEPDLPGLYADRDRIIQVIINLLSNAIKYTPAGGQIIIEAKVSLSSDTELVKNKEKFIAISVQDTGIGIPADQKSRIFERYKTLSVEDRSLKVMPSTGLGLSIARQIIQMHGGKIWAESQPGKGSKFTFILPERQVSKAGDAESETGKPGKKILVIDDEEGIREILSRELNKKGYSVNIAKDGLEGLKKAIEQYYDLVIIDIRMPTVSGIDCIQIIKKINPDIFFMIVTGFPVEQDLKGILEESLYPCIKKPFDLSRFLETVDELCLVTRQS
jgi:signal transduction histidine kinase/CheY-like chemotaxis protein